VAAFRYLCERLGRVDRVSVRLPRVEEGPGDVAVRWRCGCSAEGETLRSVTLRACARHAAQDAEARARALAPSEGLL
jgi:hypothetical protein